MVRRKYKTNYIGNILYSQTWHEMGKQILATSQMYTGIAVYIPEVIDLITANQWKH